MVKIALYIGQVNVVEKVTLFITVVLSLVFKDELTLLPLQGYASLCALIAKLALSKSVLICS